MKIRSASQFGRVSTTVLACALVLAAVPAFAGQRAASTSRLAVQTLNKAGDDPGPIGDDPGPVAQIDLAVSIAVQPQAEIGAPVTFTFTVVNEGAVDADEANLAVRFDGISATEAGQLTESCTADWTGTLSCPLGRLSSGSTTQLSLTYASPTAGILATVGQVGATQLDADPADNAAAAQVLVGRVLVNPGVVSGRMLWNSDASERELPVIATLDNESPLGLRYDIHVSDRAQKDVAPDWFAVTPASGYVSAHSAQELGVLFSTAGQAPGLKRGLLRFLHDSPFTLGDVPVSFTVAFLDVDANRADDAYIHALAGAGVTAGCRPGTFCPDAKLTRSGSTVWLLLAREGAAFEPAPADGLFEDVPVNHPTAPFIEELVRRGVAAPCSETQFCPDQPLARADAAVMVLRMLEGVRYNPPAASPAHPMFRDLRDDPRAPWVMEAVKRGLFSSCSAGTKFFCPNEGITRGDAAVSVVKAFNLPLY
jgi:hypothetical protein